MTSLFVRFQSRCQGACWMSRCSRLWRRCGWSLRCLSVPSFPWLGKRNHGGSWWSNTTCSHVGFESLLERDFPMLADHDRDVVGIASRPFAVLWPKGTERARGHVPDFFVRLSDTGLVACEGLGGTLRKKLTIKSATPRPLRQGKAIPRLPQQAAHHPNSVMAPDCLGPRNVTLRAPVTEVPADRGGNARLQPVTSA
ncbi:hypothetical protein QF036_002499 [Arthrobacter globiformis]|nr:hypothetical protein [Arthrobacter globiformis]